MVDIAIGPSGDETRGHAWGVIAIGDFASGFLAIGGVVRGVVAIGGVALGLFSVGGVAIGLLAALGGIAFGGLAIGFIAQGGMAVGQYARGGVRVGQGFPKSFNHYGWLLGHFPPGPFDAFQPFVFGLALMVICSGLIGMLALFQSVRYRDQ